MRRRLPVVRYADKNVQSETQKIGHHDSEAVILQMRFKSLEFAAKC